MASSDSRAIIPTDTNIESYLSKLTSKQREFLAHRPYHNKDKDCCDAIKLKKATPATWRYKSPDFKLAYAYITNQHKEALLQLSREIAIQSIPLVTLREVELATAHHGELKDREIGTAQAARKSLKEQAGISRPESDSHTIIFTDLSCVRESGLPELKRAGRPKGSKNKLKVIDAEYTVKED